MNFSSNHLCQPDSWNTTFHSYGNLYYYLFTIFAPIQPIFTLFGIPANLLLLLAVYRQSSWSSELRLLLANISVLCIFMTVAVSQHFFTFDIHLMVSFRPMPISAVKCMIYESSVVLSAPGVLLSVGSVATERYLITKGRLLNHGGLSKYVLYTLVVTWLGNILTWGITFVVAMAFMSNTVLCNCLTVRAMPKFYSLGIIPFYLVVEVCLIIVTIYTLSENRTKFGEFAVNRAITQSLSMRHKLWENIRISEMLLPTVIAHAFCFTIATLSSGLGAVLLDPFSPSNILVQLSHYILGAMYSLAYPCLVFSKSQGLMSKVFKRSNKVAVVHQLKSGSAGINEGFGRVIEGHYGGQSHLLDFRITPQVNMEILNKAWNQHIK